MQNKKFEYEVALSFAGENRTFVDEVANCLKENGVTVFYDKFEEVDLWGKNLYTHLHDVYSNKAKYCVMFLSKYYAEKLWTSHERESAQERAFKEKEEYILPLRFDDTVIPGIKDTVGYISIGNRSAEEISKLIIAKVKGEVVEKAGAEFKNDIIVPKIKRTISDLEKSEYLQASFNIIFDYFSDALKHLEKQNQHCKSKFKNISSSKFAAEVYVEGKLKINCKIWIGSGSVNHYSINYVESTSFLDIQNDGSLNDSAHLEDNGIELYFHLLMMGFIRSNDIDQKKASPNDVARYFWLRFINYLT